jgi:hypothetical protein
LGAERRGVGESAAADVCRHFGLAGDDPVANVQAVSPRENSS